MPRDGRRSTPGGPGCRTPRRRLDRVILGATQLAADAEDRNRRAGGGRARRWTARALLVLGALLAAAGTVAGHINRNVIDGPTFVDHVAALRQDDDVATQVGIAIADQVIAAKPDLVALRPLVESVSIRVAGGDALSGPV